jgi:hypothetical protein
MITIILIWQARTCTFIVMMIDPYGPIITIILIWQARTCTFIVTLVVSSFSKQYGTTCIAVNIQNTFYRVDMYIHRHVAPNIYSSSNYTEHVLVLSLYIQVHLIKHDCYGLPTYLYIYIYIHICMYVCMYVCMYTRYTRYVHENMFSYVYIQTTCIQVHHAEHDCYGLPRR